MYQVTGDESRTLSTAPADLTAFCEREYPRLVGALDLYCGDRAVAEEVAQEALLRACRDWPKVSAMGSPGGWTHRVAVNLATSHFRRRQAERRATDRLAARPELEDGAADPADVLAVRAAIARLPDTSRGWSSSSATTWTARWPRPPR